MAVTPHRKSHAAGFTLVELLLVMALVAGTALAAAMTAAPLQRFALEKAAEEVMQALRYARRLAREGSNPVTVVFGQRTVQLVEYDLASGTQKTVKHPLRKGQDYVVPLAAAPLTGTDIIFLRSSFTYANTPTPRPDVSFIQSGMPVYVQSSTAIHPMVVQGTFRGVWGPSTGYAAGDWVFHDKLAYDVSSAHTSGSAFEPANWTVRNLDLKPPQITLAAGSDRIHIHLAPSTGFLTMQAP